MGCAAVASLFAYRLTRNLFGEASAVIALVLMQALPFFFLGGLLMTPDAPLTAAWAASLYFMERALIAGQARAWLWAGVSIGLGLISKYTIAMLVPAAFLFMILDAQSRRWLLRWEPYAALIIAAVIFSPVILVECATRLGFFCVPDIATACRGAEVRASQAIISVLVLLTPVGLVTLLISRFSGTRRVPEDLRRRWLFLRMVVLVPLSVFVLFSVRHDVKIDWTGALWLGAVPALATSIASFGSYGHSGLSRLGSFGLGPDRCRHASTLCGGFALPRARASWRRIQRAPGAGAGGLAGSGAADPTRLQTISAAQRHGTRHRRHGPV